ncbi:FadR/GntR family transcriptional regulator [Bacillus thermotolerans]|uniref:Transcriptional regulator, GntR family n=1 Tax=Bacillus thermotolerans TaxID=1221996 RepID=A0A0F5HJZ7_BACTR|nr:FadR/GntR family transcriptional regulator [Bacillus thermotolerans]KKB33621.1 Transcriptional regulator, GntR family [Bacillus thermotolerans]KKB41771.1 Transcriptional regulator, GntR family [Bacillus thermotolerans]KKB44337.1 Transcriptional regulator, GntR family [Bacillus thermotolerans]
MPGAPKKTFKDVVEHIKENIANGTFAVDTKMPAERVLAEELQTSRATVREALRALESIGVVESRVGQGTFVRKTRFTSQDPFASFSNQSSPSEVFTARLAIEPYLSELATRRATSEDLSILEASLKKMEKVLESKEEFEVLNAQFHHQIAAAARSALLLKFTDIIEGIHSEELWGKLISRSLKPEMMSVYHQQHLSIYQAIKERDHAKAREYTIQHLKTVRTNMLDD